MQSQQQQQKLKRSSLIDTVASSGDPVFIDKSSSASVSRGETKEGGSSHWHLEKCEHLVLFDWLVAEPAMGTDRSEIK